MSKPTKSKGDGRGLTWADFEKEQRVKIDPPVAAVQAVRAKVREANLKLIDVVKKSYPVGSVVLWHHGSHVRSGRVSGHSIYHADLQVDSMKDGGRRGYWICSSRVFSVSSTP